MSHNAIVPSLPQLAKTLPRSDAAAASLGSDAHGLDAAVVPAEETEGHGGLHVPQPHGLIPPTR